MFKLDLTNPFQYTNMHTQSFMRLYLHMSVKSSYLTDTNNNSFHIRTQGFNIFTLGTMLTIVLLTLAAVYGFTGASEECETPVSQYCKIHDYNFDAPTTKDALATFCENGKQALECVVSLLRKCKANGDDLSKFREIQANVKDICDEHNILYQVIYENIECIGIALTSAYFGCPQSVEEGMKRVITEKGIASELEEHSTCSASLYLLSCHVMYTRQLCGKVPGDATLEVYKIFRFPMHCRPELAAELLTIVETIELVKQEETDFDNTLRKK